VTTRLGTGKSITFFYNVVSMSTNPYAYRQSHQTGITVQRQVYTNPLPDIKCILQRHSRGILVNLSLLINIFFSI
jgi:hypothetical protein